MRDGGRQVMFVWRVPLTKRAGPVDVVAPTSR